MLIADFFIFVFGVTAVWLTQQPNPNLKKYSGVFGLLSQPFWFISAFIGGSWGIFFLSFVYSYIWWSGFSHNLSTGQFESEIILIKRMMEKFNGKSNNPRTK